MINQTPISVRMNTCTLYKLDAEATNGWLKRNALINKACEEYIELQELKRLCASDTKTRAYKRQQLQAFLWRWSRGLHELL